MAQNTYFVKVGGNNSGGLTEENAFTTVNKPVKREIFAANFRDRVIHHFLIQRINPLFESVFITDSYACRKGKGTLFGVKRIFDHIYNCSHKYTKECYVLKLDISGFFMSISREILLAKVLNFVELNYLKKDKSLIQYLCTTIILTNPVEEAIRLGNSKNWDGLPKNKSLFYSKTGHGLPIGNLTSQVFANFYMHYFDSFVKDELKIKYYACLSRRRSRVRVPSRPQKHLIYEMLFWFYKDLDYCFSVT